MRRWCQGQAVDERRGVGHTGRMEIWVLIQRGSVTRDGAEKTGAL